MAEENPGWGYTRIRGALANLGHEIARNTVKRILQEHGIDPAPERRKRTNWETFLKAHWEGLAATDLFTVEVLTLAGLRRYFVFFIIELKTRRVPIAGIHHQPYGEWMEQVARNLTDAFDGFLRDTSHMIHDRDPLFTQMFDLILKNGGVTPIKLPPRSPNLNAYAEGSSALSRRSAWVGWSCLGKRTFGSLSASTSSTTTAREPPGAGQPALSEPPPPDTGRDVRRRKRVGGLLNYYHREAA